MSFISVLPVFMAWIAHVTAASQVTECEGWGVELTTRACDATCHDPTPDCLITNLSVSRCGCAPGHVLAGEESWAWCVPIYQCANRDEIPTQCKFESLLDKEVKCDEEGRFVEKQVRDGVTSCVIINTGATIPGKKSLHSHTLNCSDISECQSDFVTSQQYSYDERRTINELWFQCDPEEGNYTPKQCPFYLYGTCRCVSPVTGSIISGLEDVPFDYDCKGHELTKCQKEFVAKDLLNYNNLVEAKLELPDCWYMRGYYSPSVCDRVGMCQCQDPMTGFRYPGKSAHMECSIELTVCQKEFAAAEAPSDLAASSSEDEEGDYSTLSSRFKECDDDGRFVNEFCDDVTCWCVDPDTGAVDESSQVPASEKHQLRCPEPRCRGGMKYDSCAGCDRVCDNLKVIHLCDASVCRRKCTCPDDTVWSRVMEICVPENWCVLDKFI